MLKLDKYQKEILETKGNIVLCSGRQVGKSTIISIRDGERAVKQANQSILIISATERQAEEIFIKTLNYLTNNYKYLIKGGKDRPTRHIIRLKNGSIIRCLPTGLAGTGIRGFTINKLTADEAAFIPENVWSAVTPMLLTTGGDMDLLSTPRGKQGYFYECYLNKNGDFKVFHVNSEEVIRNREICASWTEKQRDGALNHLEREKLRMSNLEYAQEYLGEFVEDVRQFFTDKLLKKICIAKRKNIKGRFYLGVDVAGLGDDETTFEIINKIDNDHYEQIENITTNHNYTTETTERVIDLHKQYNFKKIGVDDGGTGFGVFSELLRESNTKRRVVALNNSSRPIDKDEKKRKRILKEDMYFNLLALMEKEKIILLDDDNLIESLRSVQWELVKKEGQATKTRIFGRYTHIAEGLIRAAWLAYQDKTLNIWAV